MGPRKICNTAGNARMNKKRGHKSSRRRFMADLARGLGAAGVLAGTGCDPSTYWDYLTSDEVARVNDRFHESVSGHAKDLVFPEPQSERFSFLWLSDIHITEGQPDFMDKLGHYAEGVNASMVLHSGDCVDRGLDSGFQKWRRRVDNHLPCQLFTAIGNHDIYNYGWELYKLYMGPSVFYFDYGPCQFVFIDAAAGTLGYDQMQWLERVLAGGKSAPIRFVLGHYPLYEGKFQTPAAMGNTQERMMLMWMFDEYNVDYYLCGHYHSGLRNQVRGVKHWVSGAGSAYKQILGDDYHFYRFDVEGTSLNAHKIYFEDVDIT